MPNFQTVCMLLTQYIPGSGDSSKTLGFLPTVKWRTEKEKGGLPTSLKYIMVTTSGYVVLSIHFSKGCGEVARTLGPFPSLSSCSAFLSSLFLRPPGSYWVVIISKAKKTFKISPPLCPPSHAILPGLCDSAHTDLLT